MGTLGGWWFGHRREEEGMGHRREVRGTALDSEEFCGWFCGNGGWGVEWRQKGEGSKSFEHRDTMAGSSPQRYGWDGRGGVGVS